MFEEDDDFKETDNINEDPSPKEPESQEPETDSEDKIFQEKHEKPEEPSEEPAEEHVHIEGHHGDSTVTVQPVQFASFEDLDQVQGPQNQNLNILLDVKLQLTVELGRTELPIKKVLELTKGSIVTLNKAAGEPVELYANGKLIAYGEVVVIEDNFGLRITHITDPAKRLHSLGSNTNTQEN